MRSAIIERELQRKPQVRDLFRRSTPPRVLSSRSSKLARESSKLARKGLWVCSLTAVFSLHALRAEEGTESGAGANSDVKAAPDRIDFNRDVRTILSDKCWHCHGPASDGRAADLRLDQRDAIFAHDPDNPVIVPGKPKESSLIARIRHEKKRKRMPPAKSKLSLSPQEIATLEQWIREGAEWAEHWAFVTPRRYPQPELADPSWVRQPIDAFIARRHEEAGLAASPPASRERWLRRVTIDLSGLPPTIDEVDAFLADDSPEARDKVVDRLLASVACAERLAGEWLDVARFADTYGYQADRFNHLWPWRDWVIDAFADALPYDDFIIWQIAGDLLPDATQEQVLATAFNRNHRQTNEGGSTNEEFRVEYNADRVKTTSTAFLGITLECARCHDHKFDPITQRDYYSYFGFFNSTHESGVYSHFTDAIPSPTLLLYTDEQRAVHRRVKDEIASLEERIDEARSSSQAAFDAWLAKGGQLAAQLPGLTGRFPFDQLEGGRALNEAGDKGHGKLVESPELVPGYSGKALSFHGENSVDIPEVANFHRYEPFSIGFWMKAAALAPRTVVIHHSKAGPDAGSRGYEVLLEHGHAKFSLIHFWPGNAVSVRSIEKLPIDRWVHLAVTWDGSSRADGAGIFIDGQRAEVEVVEDHLFRDIVYGNPVPLQLAARFRGPGFKDGLIDELRVFDRQLAPLEIAQLADRGAVDVDLARNSSALSIAQKKALHAVWLARGHDDAVRRLEAELLDKRREESRLVESVREVMCLGDLDEPRPTHVLARGSYDAPTERVEVAAPSSILPFDETFTRDRIGFARWLTDPRQPLTARVTVNRYWQLMFGRGIVSTPEDFGSQGSLPTHPELLDDLARRFVDSGWNLGGLLRELALSATYGQSGSVSVDSRRLDPENLLLSRGPTQRLSAEMVRDVALDVSGLLDRRVGGPSVQPGTLPGFKKTDKTPRADPEKHRFRRSLYMYIQRTSPSPFLITFDATGRETCIVERQTTNTPLQGLILLNDALFTDASQALARSFEAEGGDLEAGDSASLSAMFRRVLARVPRDRERDLLKSLYEKMHAELSAHPERAREFLDAGRFDAGEVLDPARRAALAYVATALLNHSELIQKR